jgi:hypothetical protein
MIALADALIAERQERQFIYKEQTLRRQMAHEVLRALSERLSAADLPRWNFIANGDEVVVLYHPTGTGTRERIGSWTVDRNFLLSFGDETIEWITSESWARVLDKAVTTMAKVILDRESRVIPLDTSLGGRFGDQHLRRQPDRAS